MCIYLGHCRYDLSIDFHSSGLIGKYISDYPISQSCGSATYTVRSQVMFKSYLKIGKNLNSVVVAGFLCQLCR